MFPRFFPNIVTSNWMFSMGNHEFPIFFSRCFWLFSSSFSMTPGEKGGRRLHHGPGGQHADNVNVNSHNSHVVLGVGLRLGAGGDG